MDARDKGHSSVSGSQNALQREMTHCRKRETEARKLARLAGGTRCREEGSCSDAGCELTGSTRSYTFKVDEDDDSEHILALSMVCLTDGAKDECNVVEVVGRNRQNQEIAVPVANLKLSCQPALSLDNFQLQPPVTFHLKSGSGPVQLSGRHQIMHRRAPSEEEESAEEEEEEELTPIMPAKKQRRRQ
ncbi:nucleoplasmin-3 isoform X2 [Mauremys reevesii]|uniref:nucleoplasmin-3 isoform X2 n=1 Tax=Mauremys reevesii TaxID=260615 RepID=UPI00193F4AC7|nr:nucleoplasmin-3 isoform X2 [Mauremys reevesii]